MSTFEASHPIADDVALVNIDSLTPHPLNARKHRLDLIMQSLTLHGQRSPLVVQQSTRTILKGHGTWMAAKQLGWKTIAASMQDFNDDEALAYLLDDNKTSDKATYDKNQHLKALQMLMAGPAAQQSIWSADDVADLADELRPLAELDSATDAAYTHEQAGAEGKDAQAKRESGAQTDQERLKDIRFPLTLADHAVFVDRLKVLQKAYGTAGAIATIMETVRRQWLIEAEGATVTGKVPEAPVEGQLSLDDIAAAQTAKLRPPAKGKGGTDRTAVRDWSESSSAPDPEGLAELARIRGTVVQQELTTDGPGIQAEVRAALDAQDVAEAAGE